tara:strand:- start:406 stop:720 length:315 start_codon:yes stop_codon:yes gene_type:complete
MLAANGSLETRSFLKSGWLKALGAVVGLVVFLSVIVYSNSSRVISLLDDHFYEETLATCVVVFGWVAPDRQKVVLQTFCNVSMFTIAAQNLQETADAEEKALKD